MYYFFVVTFILCNHTLKGRHQDLKSVVAQTRLAKPALARAQAQGYNKKRPQILRILFCCNLKFV